MTYLTVPITASSISVAAEDIRRATAAGCDMLELRLDYLTRPSVDELAELVKLAKQTQKPVIVTCRPSREGGLFAGPEQERLALIKQALTAGPDYVDLELASLENINLDEFLPRSTKLIISKHDFDSMPSDISNCLYHMWLRAPAVAKLAYKAHDILDSLSALDIARTQAHTASKVIILAMDSPGEISRILAKKAGCFLTYASLSSAKESAPGQLTIEQMLNTYRWARLKETTKLYGIVGHPVAHSLSPAIHNGGFDQLDYDGLYLPLLVEPGYESFARFMDTATDSSWLDLCGVSITIPHKENALRYVLERSGSVEPLARRIGAVNTILIGSDGSLRGFNTDYSGALSALTDVLSVDKGELSGRRVAVFGAGGVARAVVAGLIDSGVNVTIFNRTVSRAERLAEEFGCAVGRLAGPGSFDFDIVVNCTSVGMHPNVDQSPLPAEYLRAGMVVFETIYNPAETLLLRGARSVGLQVVDGLSMFIFQAARQFELFTSHPAPLDVFRRCVLRTLDPPRSLFS